MDFICGILPRPIALPARFFAKVTTSKKLSTYECKETTGLFHILEWTVSVGFHVSKKQWMAVYCIRRLGINTYQILKLKPSTDVPMHVHGFHLRQRLESYRIRLHPKP